MDLQTAELQDLNNGRLWFYSFLANALFQKPEPTVFQPFREYNALAELVANGEENEDVRILAEVLQAMGSYTAADWHNLQEDYSALFYASGKVLAPPWESVYLSQENIIMDEHTLAVQTFYADCGLATLDRKQGPCDHIGLEMSFLAAMTQRILTATDVDIQANLHKQLTFIEQHPMQYLTAFADLVRQHSTTDFYRALINFLVLYINSDRQELSKILK